MLLPGTEMHIITFIFVCIEIVIFSYLLIYRSARPDDKKAHLNIVLIFLLIVYNITGGLLPDSNMPGSYFLQEIIAYATGFITPSYFPYYVYKAFDLDKMKFHANKGVFLFLILPYLIFVLIFALTGDLDIAKELLTLPVLYAIWVIASLSKAIRYKYKKDFRSHESKEEIIVLFFSLTPWVALPLIDYFNLGQAAEAVTTNVGFLLLFSLQVKRHISQLRIEHQRLSDSELQLRYWTDALQEEVNKRTKELEEINEQRTNTFVNLAHEMKTPLTLIKNYLDGYAEEHGEQQELMMIKKSVDKLTSDFNNIFDLERFIRGFHIYNHDQISNFSDILSDNISLFIRYAAKVEVKVKTKIENGLRIKADPSAINRITNNLIENAIKFSEHDGNREIEVVLESKNDKIHFEVSNTGMGIPFELQQKVFEDYYQINTVKKSSQGMGLGLPIVKRVVDSLNGSIAVKSNPIKEPKTIIIIVLNRYISTLESENVFEPFIIHPNMNVDAIKVNDTIYDENKSSILLIEDNYEMLSFLYTKLIGTYNVLIAKNGIEALRKLKSTDELPDLIISDIMMDEMDGFTFAKVISEDPFYNYIPLIFLSAKSTVADKIQGLKLGAIDFIPKPFSIQELQEKIASIMMNALNQKKAIIHTTSSFIRNSKKQLDPSRFEQVCKHYNLTVREKDISKLILEGEKYKSIAGILFISERTVTKHIENIFKKVGVSSKHELVQALSVK